MQPALLVASYKQEFMIFVWDTNTNIMNSCRKTCRCVLPEIGVTMNRSSSNPMDKGACNSVRTLPVLWAKFKHGIQCYYVYNWLHHSYVQQGYTEWAAAPSSCVKVARLI